MICIIGANLAWYSSFITMKKGCFATSLIIQFFNCIQHLQFIIFIHWVLSDKLQELQFTIHTVQLITWHTPKLLGGLNYESKGENNKRIRSWSVFPSSQHFENRRACWSSRMGLGQVTSGSIIHTDVHKPNNKLVSA
jgi:hypothetical protein